MGRPPMLSHLKRDKRLVVMMTEDEMAALSSAAQVAGAPSVSDWVRNMLLDAAESTTKGTES